MNHLLKLMACLAILHAACGIVAAEDRTYPNVVVFLADDAGWGDYSHSGNTQLATPNIDAIARQGVSLDRFFVNWTSAEDSMVWLLDVQTAGRYEVVIDYTCPEADAGSLIELGSGKNRLTGRVAPGWDPPLYTNQDTLPRPPAESQMKEFRPLKLGVLTLEKGEAPLALRALKIPGKSVMDVRRVTLTLLP